MCSWRVPWMAVCSCVYIVYLVFDLKFFSPTPFCLVAIIGHSYTHTHTLFRLISWSYDGDDLCFCIPSLYYSIYPWNVGVSWTNKNCLMDVKKTKNVKKTKKNTVESRVMIYNILSFLSFFVFSLTVLWQVWDARVWGENVAHLNLTSSQTHSKRECDERWKTRQKKEIDFWTVARCEIGLAWHISARLRVFSSACVNILHSKYIWGCF